VFTLPTHLDGFKVPRNWPKLPLAYVEWYTPLKGVAENNHGMYKIKKLSHTSSTTSSIVSLINIRQSCMLFPSFGQIADTSWNFGNVLDLWDTFFVNNWRDMYTYKTVW
jgi:hypothetical protein